MFRKVKGILSLIAIWMYQGCKQIRTDISGAIEIGKMVSLVITAAVAAILLSVLMPLFVTSMEELAPPGSTLHPIVGFLPTLLILAIVVGVIYAAVKLMGIKM